MAAAAPNLVTLEQALAATRAESLSRYARFINPDLAKLLELTGFDRRFVSAAGCTIVDDHGDDYLDFLGGYGALGLGHNHPEIEAAVQAAGRLPGLLQIAIGALPSALAESLAALAPAGLTKTFFCNSGAEAVEGALKLARAATGRSAFVYCHGAFHGKSFGALSVCGRSAYREPFTPLLADCFAVPFGDIHALRAALAERPCAAFIVEPIQGEAGIVVPPDGYLAAARTACAATGALLIADEVQTGFGRTGAMFACEHDRVTPDILALAKTLGGGVMPIGAFMATDDVWQRGFGGSERCRCHTSTFGGNARACAAALKTIEVLARDDLPAQARAKGERFLSALCEAAAGSPAVREVRGRGLMIGVEFVESRLSKRLSHEFFAAEVAAGLLRDHHVITAYTLNNPLVIRFEPPLLVSDEQIDAVVAAFHATLRTHGGFARATLHVGADLLRRKALGLGHKGADA
jgi:putrescine aminotransferase